MAFGRKIALVQKSGASAHVSGVFSSLWVSHIQRCLGCTLRYQQSISQNAHGNQAIEVIIMQAVTVKKGELTVGHVTRKYCSLCFLMLQR